MKNDLCSTVFTFGFWVWFHGFLLALGATPLKTQACKSHSRVSLARLAITSCLFLLSFCGHLQRLLLGFESIAFLRMTENTFYWRSARWNDEQLLGFGSLFFMLFAFRQATMGRASATAPSLSASSWSCGSKGSFSTSPPSIWKGWKNRKIKITPVWSSVGVAEGGGGEGETSAHKTSNCGHNLLICGEKVIN